MTSSWQDLLGVMDRLKSAGGCAWCGEQTHESLVKYLLEESHELAEAIETGNRVDTREELGDVLLQVVFHARIAAADPQEPFTADDVARDLIEKMVRRHPHVFAGQEVDGDLYAQWDAIKKTEKQRASVLDGIPATLGALARAQKILGRAQRAALLETTSGAAGAGDVIADSDSDADSEGGGTVSEQFGAELLDVVRRASQAGVDAEGALRAATRLLATQIRATEIQATER